MNTIGRWRLVDVTVASAIGVSAGVLFWVWGLSWTALSTPLDALLPGVGAALAGVWSVAGVVGGLVIRKPGAAVLTEMIAALVSAVLGSQWGLTAVWSGFVQGFGAELVFALVLYRAWGPLVAVAAGAVSGLAMALNDLWLWYPGASEWFATVYIAAAVTGGAVIAGLGGWVLYRALERSGVLRRLR